VIRRWLIAAVVLGMLTSAVTGLTASRPAALADAPTTALPPPIPNSQPLAGPAFDGAPAATQPLPHPTRYRPVLSLMHADAGNTNSSAFPGPVGINPKIQSALQLSLAPFMWDSAGRLTTGCVSPVIDPATGRSRFCIAAVDPVTLQIEARWFPPEGQTLNLAYVAENALHQVLVTTRQGHVYIIQRTDGPNGPGFSVVRDVDLVADGTLGTNELLLAAMFDTAGNIWFTTGGILGIGDQPAPFTTMGDIDRSGGVHSMHLAGQIVENGIAVSGSTIFMVTGPAPSTGNTVGYMDAFTAGPAGSVQKLWQQAYDAGSGRKPGGFARGSGTTPTLLSNRYVTITDNADTQIHLLMYRLGDLPARRSRLACTVPLFTPGASADDIGSIGFRDGRDDAVIAFNDYNAPPLGSPQSNASFNDMNQMAPGVERVDITPQGKCLVTWHDQDVRIKSVPFLSTATGLVYGYTQDPQLAAGGEYVWYFIALDARTGKVVWRIRAGAGGTYNDSYSPGSLGPDGTFYQGLPLGVVRLNDGS
jgi:hypothetical protein